MEVNLIKFRGCYIILLSTGVVHSLGILQNQAKVYSLLESLGSDDVLMACTEVAHTSQHTLGSSQHTLGSSPGLALSWDQNTPVTVPPTFRGIFNVLPDFI